MLLNHEDADSTFSRNVSGRSQDLTQYITFQKAVLLAMLGSLLKCKAEEVSHGPVELTESMDNSICGVVQIRAFFCSNGWKSELPNNYWSINLISNFNKICETVSGIHGKVCLWPYVNRAQLWISTAEYLNSLTTLVSL
jgi:hypothetical protein